MCYLMRLNVSYDKSFKPTNITCPSDFSAYVILSLFVGNVTLLPSINHQLLKVTPFFLIKQTFFEKKYIFYNDLSA